MTNSHLIAGATAIAVTDVGNGRTYGVTVVGYDRADDVALLQMLGASSLPTVSLGSSAGARAGEAVVAIGNAGGAGGTPSALTGRASGVDQTITVTDQANGTTTRLAGLIHVAASLQPGDSGGPLVDGSGHVIGIDTAASTGPRSAGAGSADGYAIPIDHAMAIAGQIAAGSASSTVHIGPTAMLGLQATPVVGQAGVPAVGATVAGVIPGSPAELAGVLPGDVMTSLDGHAITSLGGLIDQHKPGDTVRLSWTDPAGQSHTAAIRLASGPPA